MENIKKTLLIIFVILLVVGSSFGAFYFFKKYFTKSAEETDTSSVNSKIILADEYPPGITDEWILEPDVQIVSRIKYTNEGNLQGTLIYESKLSQKVAALGYEEFLKKQGWITQFIENKKIGLFTINAVKGGQRASIIVDQNDISKIVTVDVTVVENSNQ
jgi:hypothetical protein